VGLKSFLNWVIAIATLGILDRNNTIQNSRMQYSRKIDRVRGVPSDVQKAVRSLRDNMTDAEELLWSALRNKQLLGLRFRRQHAVGNCILDFYCPAYKLAIEVDGAVHDDRQTEDALRTQKLEQHNYQVLRFHNEEIRHDLNQVLQRIITAIQSRQTTPQNDSAPPTWGLGGLPRQDPGLCRRSIQVDHNRLFHR
jgi:very-short-patch-repair endonuclease